MRQQEAQGAIDEAWEGIMLEYNEQDFPSSEPYKRQIPGWRCRRCGRKYGTSGLPPKQCDGCIEAGRREIDAAAKADAPPSRKLSAREQRELLEHYGIDTSDDERIAALTPLAVVARNWFDDHGGADCLFCGPVDGEHDEGCPVPAAVAVLPPLTEPAPESEPVGETEPSEAEMRAMGPRTEP